MCGMDTETATLHVYGQYETPFTDLDTCKSVNMYERIMQCIVYMYTYTHVHIYMLIHMYTCTHIHMYTCNMYTVCIYTVGLLTYVTNEEMHMQFERN